MVLAEEVLSTEEEASEEATWSMMIFRVNSRSSVEAAAGRAFGPRRLAVTPRKAFALFVFGTEKALADKGSNSKHAAEKVGSFMIQERGRRKRKALR